MHLNPPCPAQGFCRTSKMELIMSSIAQSTVALVTGGNRGIGLAIVKALADQGLTVLMGCRNLAQAEKVAETIAGEVHPVELNLSGIDLLREQVNNISIRFPKVDILVNNAGVLSDTDYLYLTPTELMSSLQTNSIAPFQLMQHFGYKMKHNGVGRIVNVSSGWGASSGILDSPAAYAISKSCLNTLTQLAAQALGGRVKVNAMCPGWVRTAMGGAAATRSAEQGAQTAVWLATTEEAIPSGKFFRDQQIIPW